MTIGTGNFIILSILQTCYNSLHVLILCMGMLEAYFEGCALLEFINKNVIPQNLIKGRLL